jgi:hypothetical protein
MRCCVCGESTADASDYVEIEITAGRTARQFLGAHAEHLNEVLRPGFKTEVHLIDG